MMVWPEGRMEFVCTIPAGRKNPAQRWTGEVTVKRHSLCMAELLIYGRGSCINAVIGKYMSGQYICIPDIDTGCPLSRLSDIYWNRERLSAHMNETGCGNSCACPACIIWVYRGGLALKGAEQLYAK